MFTGIVEAIGCLRERVGDRFRFEAAGLSEPLAVGSSIAVNGCCLTVVASGPGWWESVVVNETLQRTNLGQLERGGVVNLERPVRVEGRLDGHIVTGHIDRTGVVVNPPPDLRVTIPDGHWAHLIVKGSVAIDGVSLTVVDVSDSYFDVAVIPHTAQITTLGSCQPGDHVNLEFDVLGKYVERLMSRREA